MSASSTINTIGFVAVVSPMFPTLETIYVSDSVRADYDRGGVTLLAKNMACADTYRFQSYMLVFVAEGVAYMTPEQAKASTKAIGEKLSTDSRNSSRQQWVEFARLAIGAINAGVDISALQSMSALRNTKAPKGKSNISDLDAYAPLGAAAQEAQQDAATAVRIAIEQDAIHKESEQKQLEREHTLNASIGTLQTQVRTLENDSRVSADALANEKAFLAFADRKIAFMQSLLTKAQAVKLEQWVSSNS